MRNFLECGCFYTECDCTYGIPKKGGLRSTRLDKVPTSIGPDREKMLEELMTAYTESILSERGGSETDNVKVNLNEAQVNLNMNAIISYLEKKLARYKKLSTGSTFWRDEYKNDIPEIEALLAVTLIPDSVTYRLPNILDHQDLVNERDKLAERIIKLLSERSEQEKRIAELESAAKAADTLHGELCATIADLEAEREASQDWKVFAGDRVTQTLLQGRIKELEGQVQKLEMRPDITRERLRQIRAKSVRKWNRIQELEVQVEQLTTQRDDAHEQLRDCIKANRTENLCIDIEKRKVDKLRAALEGLLSVSREFANDWEYEPRGYEYWSDIAREALK